MKSLLAFGILAIATVSFSHAGPIDNLTPDQFQGTNQQFSAQKTFGGIVEVELEGGEPEPCVPGGEYDPDCDGIAGIAGTDYPAYPSETTQHAFKFNCSKQQYPGFYADPAYGCQIYHICADGQQWTSICNNGTIFDQSVRNCVYYTHFDCRTAESLYWVNVDSFKPPVCPPVAKNSQVHVAKNVQAASPKNKPICLTANGEVKHIQAVSHDRSAVQSLPVHQNDQVQPEAVPIAQPNDHVPTYDSYPHGGYGK